MRHDLVSNLIENMDDTQLTKKKKSAFRMLFTINLRYEIHQDLVINLIISINSLGGRIPVGRDSSGGNPSPLPKAADM